MYSTLDSLKRRFPEENIMQLTDDDGIGVVNRNNFEAASKAAYADVNGYCGARYHVPFDTVPDMVQNLSDELTLYYLHARRGVIPEYMEKRYDRAIKKLEGISKGIISLGVDPEPAAPSKSSSSVQIVSNPKIFGRDNLKGL